MRLHLTDAADLATGVFLGGGRYQIIHAYKCNCGATRRYRNSTLVNGMVVTMTHASSSVLLSGMLVLGLTAGAHAQGTQQQFYPQRGVCRGRARRLNKLRDRCAHGCRTVVPASWSGSRLMESTVAESTVAANLSHAAPLRIALLAIPNNDSEQQSRQ
jgi:hypothetical protein